LADETPAERRARAEIMGDNVRVGHPWAGIRFDAGLLKRSMTTADAMIESLMRHYGDLRLAALPEQRDEIEQLQREIARLLVKGESGIEHLANATGTSVRTLQRRLKDVGVNYNDLHNDVRKTLALNLLENETLALGEIAFSLGYSEVSAFNHAFRRWVGQSPGDYRRLRAIDFKSAAAGKVAGLTREAGARAVPLIQGDNLMDGDMEMLQRIYDRFNARDIDSVLSVLADDVVWANGMDGGHVHGREAVRAYWTRQWAIVSPHVEPVAFHRTADGAIVAKVRQSVRDLEGKPLHEQTHGLKDKMVGHVFHLRDGRVTRFDIQDTV
jgi:AraC-like DNA-binding protein/ketosteroid isomerase-like protein